MKLNSMVDNPMKNETETLIAIEQLILEISQTLDNERLSQRRNEQELRVYARQCCDLIPAFKQLISKNIQLMFPVDQFMYVLDIAHRLYLQYGLTEQEIPYVDQYMEICLAMYVSPAAYQRDQRKFYHQECNNRFELEEYLRNLIQKHCKTLWVRVELKYFSDSLDEISILDVDQHFKAFRKRLSDKDTCFRGLVGYVWALEQGGETGAYHVHLLLIYNGSLREGEWKIASEVCTLWENMTDGLGTAYNLQDAKHRATYQAAGRDGLGLVERKDTHKLDNAFRLAMYFTQPEKYDQRLRAKVPRMRTFACGQFKPSPYMLRQSCMNSNTVE
ncbi:inovirus-type Gp2 protein [Acinetobacter haemolyticus]|uniref:YagK/YfjJ domain-containing protein n=1 Tax=Acinetobacter haemolyticus TaxID=29430 RepID=UPI001D1899BE|nr:inovirus-type Gp2 protein [Acinetobacter haemolyticus]